MSIHADYTNEIFKDILSLSNWFIQHECYGFLDIVKPGKINIEINFLLSL